MKRKSAMLVGNGLMSAGMVLMVASIAVLVLNQLPQIAMPALMANTGIMGIFVGALLRLAGARMSGHEEISDRYWWHRRFDARCQKNQNARYRF
ncbi:MAG: stress-induced protein YchH [Sodalis sp. (in: enterobacteria)]|uniref:stress-induced protein YchH n=1 Tax=Sodalis sp. (in: enterobacteria) TaxID=1898979 RepID=UPI003F2F294C